MRYSVYFILIIVLVALFACNNDATLIPKDYPYIVTNAPEVSPDGAEFSAELTSMGNQEILRYGFVWKQHAVPTIQDHKKLFEGVPESRIFSYYVNGDLFPGRAYSVRAYVQTDQFEVYGNTKSFISLGSSPPVIQGFSPDYGPVGTRVIIRGKNFSTSETGNTVRFGSIAPTLDSVSESRITVTIPYVTMPGKVPVSVETAGKVSVAKDSFDLWFPWRRLNNLYGQYYRGNPISFSIGNKGFFGIGTNRTSVWEYDASIDSFFRKLDFPVSVRSYPYSFAVGDRGYVLLLNEYMEPDLENELWEYDPYEDSWTRKADFPGVTDGIEWEADINGYFGFSVGSIGYVGIASDLLFKNNFFSYNPASDNWSLIGEYPGHSQNGAAGFVIDEKIYLGFNGYSEFFEFNPDEDHWKQMQPCSDILRTLLSFTIKDKGYLGVIRTQGNDKALIMYEFDPSKN